MSSPPPKLNLELFILTGGLYPRRVMIYLHEKGLLPPLDPPSSSPPNLPTTPKPVQNSYFNLKVTPCSQKGLTMIAPGKPPGSLPILKIAEGRFIKQSVAIIFYLEELLSPSSPLSSPNPKNLEFKSMRGETAEEKARNLEVLGLADEATSLFGLACHKGSAMFVLLEETDAKASRLALEGCEKALGVLERDYYGDDLRFLESRTEGRDGDMEVEVTIADIILFTLLQFAQIMYKKDLSASHPGLKRFYEAFGKRESARRRKHPEGRYCIFGRIPRYEEFSSSEIVKGVKYI
ncbi:hypothetical protein BGZ60DRAFT_519932 [Tricladium varicosporioides]|nr:hypothetical protein BGZ60DRAFT_519932 [Hymenoscyphus varicosporioides]